MLARYFSLSVILVALCSTAYADPQATRDDIEISRILNVPGGTLRIAKDPRNSELYTLRQNGAIDLADLAAAEHTPAYSRDDHGIRSGFTGFAIGPDGSFYLASNRRGPRDSGQFALARGILLDADTGERQWDQLDPDNLPADVPIDDILAATSLGRDPTTNTRYALKPNGDITLVPSGTVYTVVDHGFSRASALFIDDAGTFYVLKRIDLSSYNIATITKGEVDPSSGERTWFTLAETTPYERCDCIFNHEVNGLVVSPDNRSLFINSGSRTDHGEVQDGNRQFPDLRETALTAIVLRVPTDARDLVLPNDRDALRAEGFLFAEGLRNAYDLAFAPNGDLFATENGPDRDMAEELNWLREGHHYGFPWRMGLEDTPQQFPDYEPASDFLLPARFTAVREGYYHNDPTYPPPPRDFTEPVINLGPDADAYRDPADGRIKDASEEGVRFGTFTAHRSPLGLVFDADNTLAEPFQGDGFVLSWTEGDPDGDDVAGPFNDPSEDLLHLDLAKVGDNYEARVTRIVGGFSNPIDAEIIDNRIYVIEWGGGRGLWEIVLPQATAETAVAEAIDVVPAEFALAQNFPNPFNASTTITFQLGLASQVELAIYSISGQRVRTLISGSLPAGHHRLQWDGHNERGEPVASGAYLYQLSASDFVATRQLLLLK
ncbi:MAG: PQQ-dependent sugar dehydrogenase [Candidatus Latescibacteria bacterium]|nr:PQQ-dependent sugar dehydrogenase [Candidatus Latescibacterota bacterium]